MRRQNLFGWVAALALVILPATRVAVADEPGTLTLTGTFTMDQLQGTVGDDLAAVFADGGNYTWTLTLHGTSYTHVTSWMYRTTNVYATSFDLEFFGPDAATLNDVVAGGLAGGQVTLQMINASQYAMLYLAIGGPVGSGIGFWAGANTDASLTLFPVDATGFPTATSEPASIFCEETDLYDQRAGNFGNLTSWYQTVTIAGDVGSPVPLMLGIDDAWAPEGDRGSSVITMSVTLSTASDQTVTVDYRTVDATAISVPAKSSKADYVAASGTLTFLPGETLKTITISIKPDRTREGDEYFKVQLSNASGATILDGLGYGLIQNDD